MKAKIKRFLVLNQSVVKKFSFSVSGLLKQKKQLSVLTWFYGVV